MKKYAILTLTAVMAASILTVPAKALTTQPRNIAEGGCVITGPWDTPKDYCDIEPMNRGIPFFYRACRPGDVDGGGIDIDVQQLQCYLSGLGYSDLDKVGFFGPKTQKAVEDFQTKHELEVDGIVTPGVWRVIMDVSYSRYKK